MLLLRKIISFKYIAVQQHFKVNSPLLNCVWLLLPLLLHVTFFICFDVECECE